MANHHASNSEVSGCAEPSNIRSHDYSHANYSHAQHWDRQAVHEAWSAGSAALEHLSPHNNYQLHHLHHCRDGEDQHSGSVGRSYHQNGGERAHAGFIEFSSPYAHDALAGSHCRHDWAPEVRSERTEHATEPATEHATEPATEHATEPATEHATEPATEPATEHAATPSDRDSHPAHHDSHTPHHGSHPHHHGSHSTHHEGNGSADNSAHYVVHTFHQPGSSDTGHRSTGNGGSGRGGAGSGGDAGAGSAINPVLDQQWQSFLANLGIDNPNSFFMTQFYNSKWNPDGPSRSEDCGPTSLAMFMLHTGHFPPGVDGSDPEKLIRAVRLAMTGSSAETGTTERQVEKGARAAGIPSHIVSGISGLDSALAKGEMVVAVGNPGAKGAYGNTLTNAQYSHFNGSHFILVVAHQGNNYVINDPLSRKGSMVITAAQMKAYLTGNGGQGSGVALG